MMKNAMKYFVTRVKDNDETILFQFDDEKTAKEKMYSLGKNLLPYKGVICLTHAALNDDGTIDCVRRKDIAACNRMLYEVALLSKTK